MAITLADFTKIWASTSPLTPYSFSDANYQEGWNFVGATPPARQMWDSIQKNNDEKLKYIVDNFLPLSGGTMTGDILYNGLTNDVFHVGRTEGDGSCDIGWFNGNSGDGANIALRSAEFTGIGDAGEFIFIAKDSSASKKLIGKPDGTLTWNGQSIPDRSYGVTIVSTAGQNTYTFDLIEYSAVIFAKRGNNASISMVTQWDSTATTFVTAGTNPVSITTSANSTSVTITNTTSSAIAVKILNGGKL